MAEIRFERWKQVARFHNPLRAEELDEQEIEVRVDPLMGHQSIFNAALEDKTSILFPPTEKEYLEQRAEKTEAQCFLCDGKWQQMTPQYSEKVLPEGRLVKNDVVLFPNLFPLAAYHAVVMLGNRHCRDLNDFPATMLKDAIAVSLEFMRRCHKSDSSAVHFTINANYLFPAGSSVLHPHLQVLGAPFPGTQERLLLDKSQHYFEEQGSSYWMDLAGTEKRLQERWLGELEGSCWFTAYAPLGVNEVNAITPNARHFLEWSDAEINGLAEGIAGTLRAYFGLGFSTFNFSCFSAPINSQGSEFCCFLRLINRQNVVPHYRTDDFFFQKLLGNSIIIYTPEHLASVIKEQF
jgi:UDPglucose--hexose-1-phosphate uridylyltransferase